MLKAKFKCESVLKQDGAPMLETVTLKPVLGTEGENAQWSKWTPSGELKLVISNPVAQGLIQPGREYYLDLCEAEPTA